MSDERKPAAVVSLAALRADDAHARSGMTRGRHEVLVMGSGQHLALRYAVGGVARTAVYLTLDEARELAQALLRGRVDAEQIAREVLGLVSLGWCAGDASPVKGETVRGRIAERAEGRVLVAIEPEAWQREPREGWPAGGWYRTADGWPLERADGRRGYRIVSRIPAPPAPTEGP